MLNLAHACSPARVSCCEPRCPAVVAVPVLWSPQICCALQRHHVREKIHRSILICRQTDSDGFRGDVGESARSKLAFLQGIREEERGVEREGEKVVSRGEIV